VEEVAAVEEPELKQLIGAFRAPAYVPGITEWMLPAVQNKAREKLPMLRWFHALMPQQGRFFELFEAHALTLTSAADAMGRLVQGGPAIKDHIREITEREHDADDIFREVLHTVRRTFLTPFDRSAITALIGAMDDAIDEMHAAAGAIDLYEAREFDPEMKDMTAIIVDAARLTAEAMPLLRDVSRNGGRLHELTERLVRMEGHADEIHSVGLKKKFQEHGAADAMKFIVAREIYKHLERIVDAFEDVAHEIDSIVIDHS